VKEGEKTIGEKRGWQLNAQRTEVGAGGEVKLVESETEEIPGEGFGSSLKVEQAMKRVLGL